VAGLWQLVRFTILSQNVFNKPRKNNEVMFLIVFYILAILLHIFRLIYLWFKPPFLSEVLFGIPKDKTQISIYYLLMVGVMLIFLLERFGIIVPFPG
jgi:hypothetical protein